MKILHYSLGFPPYRSGGLTKFCVDLMEQQRTEGHEVGMLWPGQMLLLSNKTFIKKNKPINGFDSWEVVNPTPVSYDEGIKNIDLFIQPGDLTCYERFLQKVAPDVIHVHTLMGIHENFLKAAKKNNIKLVFSCHDFFPLCPKVTMFLDGKICKNIANCCDCTKCNNSALPIWEIYLLQTPIYRRFKNSLLVQRMRKKHRDEYLSEKKVVNFEVKNKKGSEKYLMLREFYSGLLDYMDILHYNSIVTKTVYERYIGKRASCVIPITHKNIQDNRRSKVYCDDFLRITYLGPQGGGKGFFLLMAALDEIWKNRKDFCLNVFFQMERKPQYIIEHKRYKYQDLKSIFDKTDVLIAPSILYETFGYTVLEAMSYGVPVIVTGNVGAKDIIPKDCGIIVTDVTSNGLKNAIESLNSNVLAAMNRNILQNMRIMTLPEMSRKITTVCYIGDKNEI